ncbi:MAG TPA: hypothetical protein VIH22_02540 [Cyclobacteriaceae bacterium]|jgi:hypothetical protein
MELLIILPLILLNGLFPMSEMAVVSARKARPEAASNDRWTNGESTNCPPKAPRGQRLMKIRLQNEICAPVCEGLFSGMHRIGPLKIQRAYSGFCRTIHVR